MMGRRVPQRRHYLLDSAVKPRTKDRYRKLVVQFIDWATTNDDDAHTAEDFDNLLADYIHYLYEHDAGKSIASHTLFGVLSFMPALANSVPISRRCVKGWDKLCPAVPWPPITWPVVVAIGVRLTCNGSNRAGIGCLLAFDCLLRINELLGLYREDVVEAGDKRVGTEYKGVWLRLRTTKTGNNKSVQVLNADVKCLLRQLVATTKKKQKLFPFSATTFRRYFKAACSELKVSSDVVPHSLRHGGATYLWTERNWPIANIAEHGRWASVDSARHYLQTCRALLAARGAESIVDLGRVLAADLVSAFTLAQKH
jgi:integrase